MQQPSEQLTTFSLQLYKS